MSDWVELKCLYEDKIKECLVLCSKHEQFLEARGYQKCIEMLRSEEAMIEYENTGLGSMSRPTAWADWLTQKNPYVGEKEGK